ncbi:MAG: hypothetical protein A3E01_09960 [Gammaproteobacteria bacterium RIFCSPHIGHO2_12_FULL_63_22]|nr:MAG: hypothetical protein A3E01_09960 [Gammaproteobacteria bacterium RIFCSPHIGHO2_12_FULL_63_22]
MFEVERLARLCPREIPGIMEAAADALETEAAKFGVNTHLRRAHFLAQIAHESAGFTRLEENLNYSAARIPAVWPRLADRAKALEHKPEALANAAYANKLGNGDEGSGDGYRYRGRGLIQLTGKENYRRRGAALGIDLVAVPEQAVRVDVAVRIALSFWKAAGCNALADADDVEGVTRKVNGAAMHGLEERRALTARAKAIFTDGSDLIA